MQSFYFDFGCNDSQGQMPGTEPFDPGDVGAMSCSLLPKRSRCSGIACSARTGQILNPKLWNQFKNTQRQQRDHDDPVPRKTTCKKHRKTAKKRKVRTEQNNCHTKRKEKSNKTKKQAKNILALAGKHTWAVFHCLRALLWRSGLFSGFFFCFLLFLNCSYSNLWLAGNSNCLQMKWSVWVCQNMKTKHFMCLYMFFECILNIKLKVNTKKHKITHKPQRKGHRNMNIFVWSSVSTLPALTTTIVNTCTPRRNKS